MNLGEKVKAQGHSAGVGSCARSLKAVRSCCPVCGYTIQFAQCAIGVVIGQVLAEHRVPAPALNSRPALKSPCIL